MKHAKFFGVPYEMASFTKHKARVVLLELLLSTVFSQNFGGEARRFGGEASPLHPPVDETLPCQHACSGCALKMPT